MEFFYTNIGTLYEHCKLTRGKENSTNITQTFFEARIIIYFSKDHYYEKCLNKVPLSDFCCINFKLLGQQIDIK